MAKLCEEVGFDSCFTAEHPGIIDGYRRLKKIVGKAASPKRHLNKNPRGRFFHEGDVLRFLSKNNDVWFPELKTVSIMGTEKENHTSWARYYRVSDYSSSSRSDWFSGR